MSSREYIIVTLLKIPYTFFLTEIQILKDYKMNFEQYSGKDGIFPAKICSLPEENFLAAKESLRKVQNYRKLDLDDLKFLL